jgi:hypothetical protein
MRGTSFGECPAFMCWEALRDPPVAFAVDADHCASDLGSSLAREPENADLEGIEPSSVPFRMRCYGTSTPERPYLAWSDLGQLSPRFADSSARVLRLLTAKDRALASAVSFEPTVSARWSAC